MTQYNSLNVRLSNSQLNKLKSAIKNETDVVLRLSSNMIGNSDDETNFPHKFLLSNRQVANLRKTFANHISTDIKLSKSQLTKMQKGGFLRFLAPLLKSAITHKIFETNSSFHVKESSTGKVSVLFFNLFLLVLTKLSFWQEDWALGYQSMKFRHFPDIS